MAKEQKPKETKSIINDLIFKELIKRGSSLEGKTRVWNIADSKLWYITPEQAQAFLDLEERDEKQKMFVKSEISLINKRFKELTFDVAGKKINVVDLGCGDGKKALAFVKLFSDKSKVRYCPIDINDFLIKKAVENLSSIKDLNIVGLKNNRLNFLDFKKIENSLREGDFKTNYLLLLGGSLENSDVHELLQEVRSSMHDGDVLLIGNKLTHPDPNKMVEYYSKSKQIDNLLIKTILQLGINPQDVAYGARFRGHRIEMFYTIKKDLVLEDEGKKIELAKDDKIIVTISYKYDQNSFREVLAMYFSDVDIFVSEDKTYALALCKK